MYPLSLSNFRKEIKHINNYIEHIEFINGLIDFKSEINDRNKVKVLEFKIEKHFRNFSAQKKIFEYKALIISMYGLLEKQIDIWIKEFLYINSIFVKDYSLFDDSFKKNHFDLSMKLISTIASKDYAKFQHLKKEDVFKNLYDCISTPDKYKLNPDCFTLSAGNLKHNKINEVFTLLNIQLNNGFKRNDDFKAYIGRDFNNSETDVTFSKINELVDRRNEIAHGSEDVDDILELSALKSYLEFLEKYCTTIFEILEEENLKKESELTFFKIEEIKGIWNSSIIGFEINNYLIQVNDFVIIKTDDEKYYKRKIKSIQIDKESFEFLRIKEKTNIAICLDFNIKINQTFFLKKNNE
jgi:hypothetical protein